MKRLLIAFFMLITMMVQAQIKSVSEYEIGKIGITLPIETFVRIITINDVVEKRCVFQLALPSKPTLITSISELELETILRKMDEIKVGNMNLNSDYFEKSFVTHTDNGYIEIGYYIKTKFDTTKSQQWFIKIKDGIYENSISAPMMDIYKILGKARSKLQSL